MASSSAAATPNKELGYWRKRLLPVYKDEMKTFFLMSIIFFCILFNYTIVRTLKDTLIVNAPHVNTKQVLPLAKLLLVTPASILFVILYAKMSNIFSREKLFYVTLIPFIAFFCAYAFVLYPMHEYIHASPDTVALWSQTMGGFGPLFGYWSFSLFYAMAELFGNVGVGVLFWQFANHIIPTDKAKRLYPVYGLWSNLGLIAAGLLTKSAGVEEGEQAKKAVAVLGQDAFTHTVQKLCGWVTVAGVVALISYYVINRSLDRSQPASSKEKKKKPKLSIKESLAFLAQSRYLGYITMLVLAYGITINLVEVSWKDSVKEYYGANKSAYNSFMGNLYIYTGLSTMVLIVFSQNLLSTLGWRLSASITPIVSLIMGGLFFAFLIFKDSNGMAAVCHWMGATPALLAMLLGLLHNISTKATKYSLFDPTKEMAYIPLDEESKVKGKAAIDVIGGRAGKSGGGVINYVVAVITRGNTAFLTVIGSSLIGICMLWYWAVGRLAVDYAAKLKEKEAETSGK